MFNVEKDLWLAVTEGVGRERNCEYITGISDMNSEDMDNVIIEHLGNDDYLDGVTDTLMAIQKERTETGERKSKENTFLIIGGVVLMGYGTFKIVSGIRSIIKKHKNKKKEV